MAISSKNIQLLQSYIETYRKKLENVVFDEEEFLHKKISNKHVYVDYGVIADIPEDTVNQYGELTILKRVKQFTLSHPVSTTSSVLV